MRAVAVSGGGIVLVGLGLLWWGSDRADSAPAVPVAAMLPATPRDGRNQGDALLRQRSTGDSAAPITVYEASDFQCPFCRDFWRETLPHLEREYIRTGKVRLVFLNFPIPSLHANAPAAHEFAMCAALQDRFWPVHDLLYRHQQTWAALPAPAEYFRQLADSAGLARDSLEECLGSGAVRRLIQQEAQLTWESGIQSTPSFVIEGALLAGHAPIEMWRPVLDSIYAEKTRGR